MIIYIDINYDTHSEKYRKFEAQINKLGLKSWKSNKWTRFDSSGKHSNIDTIVYSMNLQNIIRVDYKEHDKILSDHVGIYVTIRNENGFKIEYEKRKIINASWLYNKSIQIWSYLANDNMNIEDINQIFMQYGQLIPKYKNMKYKSYIKNIEKLEEKAK